MDSDTKIVCFEELSNLILDFNKKVTVKTVSNNWNVPLQVAASVLEEWSEANRKNNIQKEYLIKGVDRNDNAIVTIVPESKVSILTKKLKTSVKVLHGIEIKSETSRKLNIPEEYVECHMIKLQLHPEERSLEIVPEPVQEIREIKGRETVAKKNIFTASAIPITSKPSVKVDTKSVKPKESPEIKPGIKVEKKSPQSPKKVETGKKPSPKKKEMSKNSIASFFGAGAKTKPSTSSSTNGVNSSIKIEKPTSLVKDEPPATTTTTTTKSNDMKNNKRSPEVDVDSPQKIKKESASESLKRRIAQINGNSDSSDEEQCIPVTPEPEKTSKPSRKRGVKKASLHENGNAKKRSRIMAIVDSDSSEGEENDIKLSNETVEVNDVAPVVKKTSSNNSTAPAKKFKAKRIVSRSYEDEDGFIKTVKEVEEYSCSDEDMVEVKTEKSVEKAPAPVVKKTPPQKKAATKQGSIMSFFGKK